MSDSLPNSGAATVDISRYAVISQDRFSKSLKSRPMVGSAVATMVWLSADTNIARQTPSTIGRISASVSTQRPGSGPPGAGAAPVDGGVATKSTGDTPTGAMAASCNSALAGSAPSLAAISSVSAASSASG